MGIRLIPEWKKCLKMFSVQSDIITASIGFAWLAVPADMRQAVPNEILAVAAIVLAVFGGLGRVIQQNIRVKHDKSN